MDRIAKASDDVVRNTLVVLCQDPFIQIKALAAMDQLERRVQLEREKRAAAGSPATTLNTSNGNSTSTTAYAPPSSGVRKRKAVHEVYSCIHCHGRFTETINASDACQYHPGELVEGDQFFEDTYGGDAELSVEEMFEEDPERVDWDCCGENGLHAGCTTDWHRSHHPTQRARTGEWGR